MKKDTKRITVYDIAAIAGVSATTVSRVLNNSTYPVRQELRDKIWGIAREVGYVPNLLARSLKCNDTHEIGVVIPTISNLFYPGVILAIEKYVSRFGYNLMLCNTFRDENKELKCMRSLYEKRVSGIILSAISDSNVAQYQEFIKKGMKIVLLDQRMPGLDCPNIQVNYFKGAELAVDHLVENGHRKIAFLSTQLTRYSRRETYHGYRYALNRHGIAPCKEYELICDSGESDTIEESYEIYTGVQLAKRFVEEGIDATAVYAVNDMVAIGFIQAIQQQGLRVPEDISVVGSDDISFARSMYPALTTIRSDLETLGSMAGKLVLESADDPGLVRASIDLMPTLVQRDTVKNLRREKETSAVSQQPQAGW